jgi:DNA polymerase-1
LGELEFRSLLGRLTALYPSLGKATPSVSQQLSLFSESLASEPAMPLQIESIQVQIVDNQEKLQALSTRLQDARMISFDTETTSTDQMQAELVGISLAVDPDMGYYIPVGHRPDLGTQLTIDSVITALKKPLTDPSIPKSGHNLKYDYVLA